jgi:hypothetical protein
MEKIVIFFIFQILADIIIHLEHAQIKIASKKFYLILIDFPIITYLKKKWKNLFKIIYNF